MRITPFLLTLGLFALSQSKIDIIQTSSQVVSVDNSSNKKKGNKIRPQKSFCSSNPMKPHKCSHQINFVQDCSSSNEKNKVAACGFNSLGVKFDFNLECQACLNQDIQYYFQCTCDSAPTICKQSQNCVNGECVQLLNQPQYQNRVVCNVKSDCPDPTDVCVANKCIDKRELFSYMKKSQNKHPQLLKKSNEVRKAAENNKEKRKIRQRQEQEQLNNKIQQINKRKSAIKNH